MAKLINVDVESSVPDIPRPAVGEQWVLVRLHGHPLGMLHLSEGCTASDLRRLIVDRFTYEITLHLVRDGLDSGELHRLRENLSNLPRRCASLKAVSRWPSITVAVCTRNRTSQLAECLEALVGLDYPADLLDLLVVDNARSETATEELVRARYPSVRYLHEPRPGLDWARNRAALEARGEIIAYTDDDVIVDPRWVRAIAKVFVQEPDAMAVTGLVVPDAIDVVPQRLFEQYGGFGRGFSRRYWQVDVTGGESAAQSHGGTGKFGTGANMAFRRTLFDRIGFFDPALDVGTPTNGGGDLEMFFRVLKTGHMLVYEPAAIVRHRHRREYAHLRTQLANNGIGFYAYLVRSAAAYRDERAAFLRLGIWWFWWWNVRRLLASFKPRRHGFPRDLILAELRGCFIGLRRYARARTKADEIARAFGPQRATVEAPRS
jgi:GT2 family glycosyltransferase